MSWTGIQAVSQAQHLGSSAFSAPQMSSQNYLSRVPTLPETVYGTSQLYPQTSGQRQDAPSYYQTNRSEQLKATSSLGQHYFVDQMMNPHPYSSLYPGFDINSIRRKNASRETTGPLKAWLSQHKKNPYPTKGEKVMLAIATRMTLTQVSTWFANARRRMKKDNLGEYKDDVDGKESEPERRERSGSLSSRVSSSEADTSKELSDLSDLDEVSTKPARPAKKCVQRLFSPEVRADNLMDPASSPESLPETVKETPQASTDNRLPPVSEMMRSRLSTLEMAEKLPQQMKHTVETTSNGKPKIWSISEIIGTASKAINADNTSGFAYTSANQNRVPTISDNMQYSSYGNDLYQSNLMQTYSNYYMNGQPSYQYASTDQLNSSVTSSNTSLNNSLNTSGGFSAISDNNETILFL